MRLGRHHTPLPMDINLTPMMDVSLTVLTFFIIISMTLSTGQNVLGVNLPQTEDGTTQTDTEKIPDPLTIGLNQKGEVVIQDKPVTPAQLQGQLTEYFKKSGDKGLVVLQADRTLAYEKITKVLGQVRAIGGDRVALAVDSGQ